MFKQKSDSAAPTLAPADAVQQARTRARQRLIGAVVLLGIGIVGFPLVFETQPRPIPVDIPIEIPKKDALPPLSPPASPAASRVNGAQMPGSPPVAANRDEIIMEPRGGDAAREMSAPAPAAVASAPLLPRVAVASASAPPVRASSPVVATPARTAAATPAASKPAEATAAEASRARALLEGRPSATAEAARFVVQVGAFADADAARETRLKVEKLGFKTYTQVAQTPSGSRIRVRVGPFASRQDADAALAKAKAAGLAAVVLTL